MASEANASRDRPRRWRPVVVGVAAYAALNVAVVAWLSFRKDEKPARAVATEPAASPVELPRTPAPVRSAAVVVAATSASAPTRPARRKLLPTDPDPINPNDRAAPAANYGDAFESWDGKPPEVRTLVTVDGIRLGVEQHATVRDEPKVKAVLEQLGRELAAKEKDRTDDVETRAHDYQPILDKYAAELRPAMDGQFAFHTGRWVLFHSTVEAPHHD